MKWGAQQGWQTGFDYKPTGTISGMGWRYFRMTLNGFWCVVSIPI